MKNSELLIAAILAAIIYSLLPSCTAQIGADGAQSYRLEGDAFIKAVEIYSGK